MKIITLKKMLTTFTHMSIACCALSMDIAKAATVDVLVLYDTYTKNYFSGDPNTAMINWINQINAIYRTSQVDIQLRLVGVRQHEEAGADMHVVLGDLRVDSEVIALRDQLGADFVTQLHQTGKCGVGYAAATAYWAWNVVGPNCGPIVMAHELGHNMGLMHSRRQGDTSGRLYRYGLGYGVDNLFSTVMAYPSSFHTSRMGIFSNPNLLCKGVPCGVPVGQDQEAYAALALQNVRDKIAGFRASTTVVNDGPIKIFQHCSYGGYSAGLGVGTYNLGQLITLGVINNDISSIQVPSGYKVTLYNDDNFAGSSVVLTGNDTCLVAKNFNDMVSSIRVEAVSAAFSLTVQAESYASNNGVQLQATTDTDGGQNVGWINANDWMAYNSITIPTTGTYFIDYRVASPYGGKLSLDLNGGSIVLGQIDVPNTGGWQTWTTVTQTVTINAGTYNFGIFAVAGGWNINWWRIRK
ncbi:MAG: carbohydrate-binding protein [Cellvibrio sp.]|uniref:carbohydrate-binding protein n=1 Tax=Cellvibrio sp. TaxID=1965322 RepID=UPI00271E79A0|nr:carbohydrate-binding protein [Cellvibrio sp.]